MWVFISEQGIWKDLTKEGLKKMRGHCPTVGPCAAGSPWVQEGCHDYRYLFETVWFSSHPLELKAGKLAEHQALDVLGAVQVDRCIIFLEGEWTRLDGGEVFGLNCREKGA